MKRIVILFLSFIFLYGCSNTNEVSVLSPDTAAPFVVSVTPSLNELSAGINSIITIKFNEAMDKNSISSSSVKLLIGSNPVTGNVSYENKTVTFVPSPALNYSTNYTIFISASVKDLSGNELGNDYSSTFMTSAVPAPEITVKKGITIIPSGSVEAHDFGSVLTGDYSSSVIFTLCNEGSAALNLSGPITSGNSEFSIVSQPSLSIAAGDKSNFSVRFNPLTAGEKTAIITINNNDSNESAYTFTVRGDAVQSQQPNIQIRYDGTDINTGTACPYTWSSYTNEESSLVTITINNTGNKGLSIYSINSDNSEFKLYTDDAVGKTVAAGSSVSFQISLLPYTTGNRSSIITLNSNDPTKSTYTFTANGTATDRPVPKIEVYHTDPVNQVDTLPSIVFSTASIGSSGEIKEFTIRNAGTAPLTLNEVNSKFINCYLDESGTVVSPDFTITLQPGGEIAPGGNSIFRIQFTPQSTGYRSATVKISSNDPVKGNYFFILEATAIPAPAPDLKITYNSTHIPHEGNMHIGKINQGSHGDAVLVLKNAGNLDLIISSISINDPQFTLQLPEFPATVGQNNSINCVITFTPSGIGTRSAILTVNSNDNDTLAYRINVNGTGGIEFIRDTSFNPAPQTAGRGGLFNPSGLFKTGNSTFLATDINNSKLKSFSSFLNNPTDISAFNSEAPIEPNSIAIQTAAQGNDYILADRQQGKIFLKNIDSESNSYGTLDIIKINEFLTANLRAEITRFYPRDITTDAGNVYILDDINSIIIKVSLTIASIENPLVSGSYITTYNFLINSILDISALTNKPKRFLIHKNKFYIADTYNHRIRILNLDGTFPSPSLLGSYGSNAGEMIFPSGIDIYKNADPAKEIIFVSDTGNSRIQAFNSATGNFICQFGSYGDAQGQFKANGDIIVLDLDNIIVADSGNYRLCSIKYEIPTLPATPHFHYNDLYTDSDTKPGQFVNASGITLDNAGNIYVLDCGNLSIGEGTNSRVQIFNPTGTFITSFGKLGVDTENDALSKYITGIAVDASKNIFIADTYNNKIKKFLYGTNPDPFTYSAASSIGSANFREIPDISINETSLIAADRLNNKIHILNLDGNYLNSHISTSPYSAAINNSNDIFAIEKVGQNLFIKNFTTGISSASVPAVKITARDNLIYASGADNKIYVFDKTDFAIVAEFGSELLNKPTGIAVDSSGNIFVSDSGKNRIVKFKKNN